LFLSASPVGKKGSQVNPRFVLIHGGILIGSDAFESGIHEGRRKMLKPET